MSDKMYLEPKNGEFIANDVVKFFDNVCDKDGIKLSKSQKRSRILELMKKLNLDKENNTCILEDGRIVPIIVERKYEGRPVYCYFNTANAPQDEILKAFAKKFNIEYIKEKPEPKKEGELIAQEVLHLFDEVKVKEKKVAGDKKRATMILLFQKLYKDKEKNTCILSNGDKIPIIVKRTGENGHIAYYLNASTHRKEVLSAFAQKTDCFYLDFKENMEKPICKQEGELTSRECAKIFHSVGECYNKDKKKENKEKILQWFHYIYEHPTINTVTLPDGCKVDLVVRRLSRSQDCLCLNTADASIKPFVLKRVAEISNSTLCLDNIDLSKDDKKQLYLSLRQLAIASDKTASDDAKEYYLAYAQKAFLAAKIKTKCYTVTDYFESLAKKKR